MVPEKQISESGCKSCENKYAARFFLFFIINKSCFVLNQMQENGTQIYIDQGSRSMGCVYGPLYMMNCGWLHRPVAAID